MNLEQIGLISSDNIRVPLQRADIHVAVQDVICETKVTQEFANKEDKSIEVVYTFPLPSDAVLLSYELTLGDKAYQGQVIERKEAEANYEEAILKGDAAFRLQSVGDGLYTMSVGNLLPGESASIRFRYAQLLKWSGNRLSVCVPTTIAPRYGEASQLEPWQRPGVSMLVDYPFSLSLTVSGELANARFDSPTHPISIDVRGKQVQIALSAAAALDRDFVLNIEAEANTPRALVARDGEGSVALISISPTAPEAVVPAPRSVVIVVDCSGSMGGESIAQAKEALQQMLQHLRPEDCFELLAFGSHTKHWASRCVPASRKNLQSALKFIDKLDADLGGTEIVEALGVAIKTKTTLEPCDILLVTDGEVWLGDEFFASLQKAGRRIFAVGVGTAPAEGNLKRLAAVTSGAFEQVTPNEDMSARITRHFERLFQPRVTSTKVEWTTPPAWTADGQTGAIFAGDTAAFFAGFTSSVEGVTTVRLEFKDAEEIATQVKIEAPDTSSLSADTLVRLAAWARIGVCEDPKDALSLALDYQLVTSNTDYLAVVERAESERAKDLPELKVVPQMLAAGWGGTGKVAYSAKFLPLSVDDDSFAESAPVFSRRSVAAPLGVEQGDGYTHYDAVFTPESRKKTPRNFLKTLARRSLRITGASTLPRDISQLENMGLPSDIAIVLRQLLSKGYSEDAIVLAWLVVLQIRLPEAMSKKLSNLIGDALQRHPTPEVINSIVKAMNFVPNLSENAWNSASQAQEPSILEKIPEFLRKYAD